MNFIFRIFMWWSLKYGFLPKLAKDLREKGEHQAAENIETEIGNLRKVRSLKEMKDRAHTDVEQTARDLRLQGRHDDADSLAAINDHIKEHGFSASEDMQRKKKGKRKSPRA